MVKNPDPLKWLSKGGKKVNPYLLPSDDPLFVKHEKHLEDAVSGKRTPASGAKNMKGDVRTDRFLYEGKATSKDSIALKKAWLEKIVSEALRVGRLPALSIRFENIEEPCDKHWILIEESVFKTLSGE